MKQLSLSIPKPCHENWEAMTPEAKGRYCAACQKTVVDFSGMTDREVAQFFKKPVGSVCGRFDGSQLNRVVDVPRKRLPWIKYFFTIALPAFLFSKKAAAQGEVQRTLGKVKVCSKPLTGTIATVKPKDSKSDAAKPLRFPMGQVSAEVKVETLNTFKSGIKNVKGEAVPFASVLAKEEGRAVAADSAGMFSIKYLKLPLTLEISSIGYLPQTFLYNGEDNSAIVLQQAEYSNTTLGMVEIVASIRKKKTAGEAARPKKAEVPPATFSVYPDPVSANSSFTVDAKSLESGLYAMQLLNVSGGLVQTKELTLEPKGKQPVALGPVSAGSYFVRLTNRKTNKSFTEVLLVR